MATVNLTAARLRELLSYDPASGVFTRVKKASKGGFEAGAVAGGLNVAGYWEIRVEEVRNYGHRLAWLWMTGDWPAVEIDHINGNRADNRFSNLRSVTRMVNTQNRRPLAHGFIGTERNGDGWAARIRVNGRRVYLGTFRTREEAHEAYIAAKRKLHEGCTI